MEAAEAPLSMSCCVCKCVMSVQNINLDKLKMVIFMHDRVGGWMDGYEMVWCIYSVLVVESRVDTWVT